MNRILLLGGYGNSGRQLADQLLRNTSAHLVLAGRSLHEAQALAARLNAEVEGERVSEAYADAADAASLRQAFASVDMVVVAASTAAWTQHVAAEALHDLFSPAIRDDAQGGGVRPVWRAGEGGGVDVEQKGKPSKWVTLRALRVLPSR